MERDREERVESPEYSPIMNNGMTRDGTVEPNMRDRFLRRKRRTGKIKNVVRLATRCMLATIAS